MGSVPTLGRSPCSAHLTWCTLAVKWWCTLAVNPWCSISRKLTEAAKDSHADALAAVVRLEIRLGRYRFILDEMEGR